MMLYRFAPFSRQLPFKPTVLRSTAQWPNKHMIARSFADSNKADHNTKPSIHDSNTAIFPGSESQSAKGQTPPPPGPVPPVSPASPTPATPATITVIPPEKVPLVPPPPPGGKSQTAPPTSLPATPSQGAKSTASRTSPITGSSATQSSPPSDPPPPPPKRKRRRFQRLLLYCVLFGGLGFAGGVYYSLVSDNFHDFFTEYIPFGEDAVLYFEEREFRKRFPSVTNPTNRPLPPDTGNKITIPSKSGLSWKIADSEHQGSDLGTKGRHMSAIDDKQTKAATETAQQTPSIASPSEKTKSVEQAKAKASSSSSQPSTTKPEPKVETSPPKKEPEKTKVPEPAPKLSEPQPKPVSTDTNGPEVDQPSKIMPIPPIDPLKIKNADEPLVQDLVKLLNDIITVVNADNAASKYTSTLSKAKTELSNIGARILALKSAEQRTASEKIASAQVEFDNAAKDLVRRFEAEVADQESRWRDEFDAERAKVSHAYEERLDAELSRSSQLQDQRLRNELLEQAIQLKQQFISQVKEQVENERNGRLAQLSSLSESVKELDSLTAQWNTVLDTNLRTQHLQVAVEAVRACLEEADRPRPFIHELAALKEIAADNPVVNAAIASVNPPAYQRGIPTSAQLIDRFRTVAAEVRKASLLPEDAGVASHAVSWALSRLLFKKQGLALGEDVESVLTRTETLLEEGDLDAAAREMNALQGWAGKLSKDWVAEARKVLEVRQALEIMSTEVRRLGVGID